MLLMPTHLYFSECICCACGVISVLGERGSVVVCIEPYLELWLPASPRCSPWLSRTIREDKTETLLNSISAAQLADFLADFKVSQPESVATLKPLFLSRSTG